MQHLPVSVGFSSLKLLHTHKKKKKPDQAPEIVMGIEYDLAVDYWALGCMMYEMIAGEGPRQSHQ